jgi:hypothetical protein
MIEQPSEPMPEELRSAFREAIRLCADRELGSSKRCIRFRRLTQVSLSGICDLVLSYKNEPLPVNVHDELWNVLGKARPDLKVELALDHSYASGARCLLKVIDSKDLEPLSQERVIGNL